MVYSKSCSKCRYFQKWYYQFIYHTDSPKFSRKTFDKLWFQDLKKILTSSKKSIVFFLNICYIFFYLFVINLQGLIYLYEIRIKMSLTECVTGSYITTLVALLLIPQQFFVRDLYNTFDGNITALETSEVQTEDGWSSWMENTINEFQRFDVLVTCVLLAAAVLYYIWEWVQMNLMKRKILKVLIILIDLILYLCPFCGRFKVEVA